MYKNITIIAEVKTHSPFGYVSEHSWDELFLIASEVGDMISIHTDPRWHGSFDILTKARLMTTKPILAKGIHADDASVEKALQCGADFVLVVGRVPEIHQEECLVEPLTLSELVLVPPTIRTVWNSRDLHTGGLKKYTFGDARALFGGWLCQASNIKTVEDIHPQANAVLVGTHLALFKESLKG